MIHNMVALMAVPLIIWVAVWGYLWALDQKVKRLERTWGQDAQSEDLD